MKSSSVWLIIHQTTLCTASNRWLFTASQGITALDISRHPSLQNKERVVQNVHYTNFFLTSYEFVSFSGQKDEICAF